MRLRAALALVALVTASLAHARDAEVDTLLGKMRDAYKGTKAATFTAKMTIFGEEADQKLEAEADVTFGGAKNVMVVFKPVGVPDAQPITYVSNGTKMGLGKSRTELDLRDYDEEEFPFPLNLETLSFWQFEKQLSTAESGNMKDSELKLSTDVEWDGKKWTTLEETAAKNDVFVRYYIDPKTNLIMRCEVKQLKTMQNLLDVSLKDLDTTAEVDSSLFKIG